MGDIARFFALLWENPQPVSPAYLTTLGERYSTKVSLLLKTLPFRFHPHIQDSLSSFDAILSLPMALLHRDFSVCNFLVNFECKITGVIGCAAAEIGPFGANMRSVQCFFFPED
ncbi:uncharacterized protein BDV17DRAFT_268943 [Aspergillus undulatus]|uniref:uncharacterized protein n=1 Tax=Aspergillus undulatus TaxID=1810928 RepID=UPI003CCE46C8